MSRRLVFAALMLLLAGTLPAADLPPGKWWRQPQMVQLLNLTDEQQDRLEGIFRSSASELIDLRGAVEKENIALRGELDRPALDRGAILRLGARLNEARGRLFERELAMLVDMRSVLTDQQWNRMRNALDRLQQRQGQQRPGLMPRNPQR